MLVDKKWYSAWFDKNFKLTYGVCGYFDPRPRIEISVLGLHQVFVLPWKNEKWSDECDPPEYGIAIHGGMFWVYCGGKGNLNGGNKQLAWDLPFASMIHMDDLHTVETTDGMVSVKELEKEKGYWRDNPKIKKRFYEYLDKYDNTLIPSIYYVEHREWRPKWLTWTKLFAKTSDYIEIDFSKEVGSGKETWKGGCVGCSYNLLPDETPEECIKRMEQTRDF